MKSEGDFRVGQPIFFAAGVVLLFSLLAAAAAPPVVSNVRASQRPGTKLVDIHYDLEDPDSPTLSVTVAVSTNGGASYTLPATSFTNSGYGPSVTRGLNKLITWNAGADWNGKFSANVRFRVTADDAAAPAGMERIPAGSFVMGATTNMGHESYSNEVPQHSVYVSAFYMDRYEVTKAKWDAVKGWSAGQGYSYDFADSGQGKATNHPAHSVTWYDAVKWCNARSQQEGLVPCYYTDAGLTVVYKTGQVVPQVKWEANGYRLPTEAEWEKASRGGASGRRFPWNDADTITHSRANYYVFQQSGTNFYAYDLNPTPDYHPLFAIGDSPFTSPVGFFPPNLYGLYDMAGNLWEWCWDAYSATYYSTSPLNDPRGPASVDDHVLRGGNWLNFAFHSRVANRASLVPSQRDSGIGFRCVRSANP